jgi:hypothetical protein
LSTEACHSRACLLPSELQEKNYKQAQEADE